MRFTGNRIWPALLTTLLCATGITATAAQQELDSLQALVAQSIEQRLGPDVAVAVDRPDPRLRLAACDRPLVVFEMGRPLALGNNTVGVRCDGAQPWSIYLGARVSQPIAVLVATRPLGLGHVLTAADVTINQRDQLGLRSDALGTVDEAIGQVVSRPLSAGAVLTTAHVQQALTIRRGEQVIIRAGNGGLAVEAAGKALSDGAPGQRIRVENVKSRRIVEGTVGPDRVIHVSI